MPSVIGLDEQTAQQAIAQAGLSTGRVFRRAVAGYPVGTVYFQTIPPGRPVAPGTAVDLIVAAAPVPAPAPTYAVPTPIPPPPADTPAPPPADTPAPPPTDTPVLPPTAPPPVQPTLSPPPGDAGKVQVPSLIGLSEDDARQALGQAGLRAGRVTEQAMILIPPGTVLLQSLPPGQSVAPGTAVNLVVARKP